MAWTFMRNAGIRPKLIVLVGGSIALFMFLFGAIAINRVSDTIRRQTIAEAQNVVRANALRMETFLVNHGQIAQTMLDSPAMIEWFAGRQSHDQPFLNDPDYQHVIGFFDNVVAGHDTMVAAFFGIDRSNEYFARIRDTQQSGRIDLENYVVQTRPWWKEALAADRLYVSSPTTDLASGNVIVTIQSTIYSGGALVGIGGIDILLNTIRDVVNDMRFQRTGSAFLIDDSGRVIVFSDTELPKGTTLSQLDSSEYGGQGFGALADVNFGDDHEAPTVEWSGREWLVLQAPIEADSPYVKWRLGLLIPEELIDKPVRTSALWASLVIVFII
ncbi:MAG: hypothetical protein DRJ65_04475, partial [Acidobacteria bacterium]